MADSVEAGAARLWILKVGAFEIEDITQVHFSPWVKAVDGTIVLSKTAPAVVRST